MRYLGFCSLALLTTLTGCGSGSDSDTGTTNDDNTATTPALTSSVKTATSYDDIGDGAYWKNSSANGKSLLAVTLEDEGLALYSTAGEELLRIEGESITSADIRYAISGNGESVDLLAVALPEQESFGFYAISYEDEPTLTELGTITTGVEAEGLCLYKNSTTGALFVTGVTESGEALQYKLSFDGSSISSVLTDSDGIAEPVRTLSVGGELSACISDDETATLYIAEQDLGIWAYGAEPENISERKLVDSVGPLGALQEIEGLDLLYLDDGQGYIIAADEGAGLTFYNRASWELTAQLSIDGFDETKSLAVADDGLWLANSELDEPLYEKLLYTTLNEQEEFNAEPVDSVLSPADLSFAGVTLITVDAETDPVDDDGDAADDPAFWYNSEDPSQSLIIATNKQGGLMAYNLAGEELQYLEGGEPNNVDLRNNILDSNGNSIAIAAASNRELNTIVLYQIQAATDEQAPITQLTALGDSVHSDSPELISSLDEVYGLCMYRSADGTPYLFVNGKNGQIEQWRLTLQAGGVLGEMVRSLSVATQPEGCVADDATGLLYVGEEDVGIWQFNADESASSESTLIAQVDGEQLVADVEGLTIYDNGSVKYLIASSQGNHTYLVLDLNNDNQVVGSFALIGDDEAGLDGTGETDGIHAIAAVLGDEYPQGLFIAQDGYNIDAQYQQQNQNFKMTSWQKISEALNL